MPSPQEAPPRRSENRWILVLSALAVSLLCVAGAGVLVGTWWVRKIMEPIGDVAGREFGMNATAKACMDKGLNASVAAAPAIFNVAGKPLRFWMAAFWLRASSQPCAKGSPPVWTGRAARLERVVLPQLRSPRSSHVRRVCRAVGRGLRTSRGRFTNGWASYGGCCQHTSDAGPPRDRAGRLGYLWNT